MKVQDAILIPSNNSESSSVDLSKELFSSDQLETLSFVPHRAEVYKQTQLGLRGIELCPHGSIVSCVMGKIFAVVVDLRPESPSFREWDGIWLVHDDDSDNSIKSSGALYVPPRCGLATFSPRGAMVLLHHNGPTKRDTLTNRSNNVAAGVLWNDENLNISWPLEGKQPLVSTLHASFSSLSEAQVSLCLPDFSCDVLLYGATGYCGQYLLQTLRNQGVDVCCSKTRLEDGPGLRQDAATFRPRRVISCAGLSGTPNVEWCETHRPETCRANLVGIINLLSAYGPLNVHVTTIGTGIIYAYDEAHTLDNDVGFTEEDTPNFSKNIYVRLRIMQEKITEEVFPGQCLTLRIQYPISSDMHCRCVLSKLLNYPKIFGLSTSMTILDDLFPQINQLSLNRHTGLLNFTNPGRTDNVTLLNSYKRLIDNGIEFQEGTEEEKKQYLTVERPFSLLDTTRLLQLCPDVLPLEAALGEVFRKIAGKK